MRVTEKQLITRCSQRDRAAQQVLYETYAAKMLSVCLRYVREYDRACDLMHDGFITVFAKIGDFRGEGSFEGWMRRIFVTTALGYLRKHNILGEAQPIEQVASVSAQTVSAIERMEVSELQACIARLPDGYRTVLTLFAIEGYSHREIAQMLEISEGTSRSQYARAKLFLEKILKQNGIF